MGWFAERDHDVHILVGTAAPIQPGLHERIRVHRYPRFRPVRLPVVSSLQGRGALRRALEEIRPDIVHAHYLVGHGWQARLAGRHPYVVSPWGSDLFVAPRRSLRARIWNRATLRAADLVTVNSPYMGRVAVASGAHADRVHEIQWGVDLDRFGPGVPDEAPLTGFGLGGRRFVLSVRILSPLYRHEVVLDALALLPDDVLLVLSVRHPDPEYVQRLRQRMEELGIGDRVRLLADVDEAGMLALLRGAVATVSVPASDALPVTVLEGMATGCPPVVSDLPPIRDMLGSVAPELILVDRSPATLASTLQRIMAMTVGEREDLSARLRDVVRQRYDHHANMRTMERLYRDLASAP